MTVIYEGSSNELATPLKLRTRPQETLPSFSARGLFGNQGYMGGQDAFLNIQYIYIYMVYMHVWRIKSPLPNRQFNVCRQKQLKLKTLTHNNKTQGNMVL